MQFGDFQLFHMLAFCRAKVGIKGE
jgi:hypothetical protein